MLSNKNYGIKNTDDKLPSTGKFSDLKPRLHCDLSYRINYHNVYAWLIVRYALLTLYDLPYKFFKIAVILRIFFVIKARCLSA